jgi:outer membrane protein
MLDSVYVKFLTLVLSVSLFAVTGINASAEMDIAEYREPLPLVKCIEIALKNNHRRPASRYAVEMAEARHRQALAGYWPQITAKGGFKRMDEDLNFLFPSSSFSVPAQSLPLPPMFPAGSGLDIVDAAGNHLMTLTAFPGQTIDVPEQDVKLMDRDTYMASIEGQWLLYDGGMRKGHREQAKGHLDMMKQDSRRTDLEIIDSVKRLYYGAVLAGQLLQLGNDTLARMEATLSLTKTMYKEGSGKVKKTDFLDNKVMVETLRSMVAQLEKNELMAHAALAYTMGLPWDASVRPADAKLPFTPFRMELEELVSTAYRFNPDWSGIEAGIFAAEGAIRTARSEHLPKLALTGKLHKWWNDYDAGLDTDENRQGWSVGVGIEVPIFSGFLTCNKVKEAKARVAKIKEEKFLLKEGIGLQIRDTFLALNAAEKSHQATLDAMTAAKENRDLNTRAYQCALVETEDVIRAQMMEALMAAQHFKTRYDHVVLQSKLNLIVGTEILNKLSE